MPQSGFVSSLSLDPIASTNLRHKARPNPVPENVVPFPRLTFLNGEKSVSNAFGLIPRPLSRTENSIQLPLMSRATISTNPSSVNFNALVVRFRSTLLNASWRPIRWSIEGWWTRTISPFSSAMGLVISETESRISFTEKGEDSSSARLVPPRISSRTLLVISLNPSAAL